MKLTKEQAKSIVQLTARANGWDALPVHPVNQMRFWRQYRTLRRTVRPLVGGDGCVMVPLWGMWLGIEPDGYTHS
jgi:hypothetical protein